MHIESAMLSATVAAAGLAASGAAAVHSARRLKKEHGEPGRTIPGFQKIALATGTVFVAQMFNFALPGGFASGHLVGGILLASLLGPYVSCLMMGALLFVQALLFGDGGLLSFGVNFLTMGVIPCLLVYPLVYEKLARRSRFGAAVLSGVVSLLAGALVVCAAAALSGTVINFGAFAVRMVSVHLAIGLVEGVITGAVLAALGAVRRSGKLRRHAALFGSGALALLTVCAYLFGSAAPDGLAWSLQSGGQALKTTALYGAVGQLESTAALLPGYTLLGQSSLSGHLVCALAGVTLLCAAAFLFFRKEKAPEASR